MKKKIIWMIVPIVVLFSLLLFWKEKSKSGNADHENIAPEFTHAIIDLKPVSAVTGMVATANRYASEAASEIICKGGNAVDAAIAAQFVLNLVEPQSSGIGGGGFLLFYEAQSGKVYAYDGRETAPTAIQERDFFDKNGNLKPFTDIYTGGMSVGVPGLIRMLYLVHSQHGKLPWKDLFLPVITLARNGFPISPRLYALLSSNIRLKNDPAAFKLYFDPSTQEVKKVGTLFKNSDLADTFALIAEKGPDVFYKGEIGQAIVQAVDNSWINPGVMRLEDLANYRAKEREPIAIDYRGYKIVGFPPPSSGGVTVLETMGLLENFDLTKHPFNSAETIHLIADASSLAFADRNVYLADPDQISVPTDQLLDKNYLRKRGKLIDPNRTFGQAKPGQVNESSQSPRTLFLEAPSTTHVSIIDAAGNSVSMTSSLEQAYGSGILVRGFFLNNQMTDFSFSTKEEGAEQVNRLKPGKRPRSSMSPQFVFDQTTGKLLYVIGSPGGARIISYVIKALVGMLDYKMNPQEAIAFPNFSSRNGPLELEKGTDLERLKPKLEAMGHEVVIEDLNSGLQGIQVTPDGYIGGGDPRRESLVVGTDWCGEE